MKVMLIAGARPNFMKIAPLYREALKYEDLTCKLVHTGQHYDFEMSETFFFDLDIPDPDFYLRAGSGSHAVQTAEIMVAFEEVCSVVKPDLALVVGDVNSTLACSIVAKKMLIDVAHVEAGLRSFDPSMPEEINRIVTDSISDYLFTTEKSASENLVREGRPSDRIHFVGHVMIDNLLYQMKMLENGNGSRFPTNKFKDALGDYIFLTLHRPSNVDHKENLSEIVAALNEIAKEIPILFPVHPRTRKMLVQHGIQFVETIYPLPPLGFKESLNLWKDSTLVMTDSGGLQEETTALGVRCVTLRENTERPITIEMGTNLLGGVRKESILKAYQESLAEKGKPASIPPKWDGRASERIWKALH